MSSRRRGAISPQQNTRNPTGDSNLPFNSNHSPMADHSEIDQNPTRKKRRLTLETEPVIPRPHPNHMKKNTRKFSDPKSTRKWVFSDREFPNHKDKFVFVSYNILGVENAAKHPDLYFNVPPEYLDWRRRKRVIRREIAKYNPSILCFQEVDRFDDLDKVLQKDGFEGVYQARTGESSDGCAIFWKSELFTLLHKDGIEFKRFDLRDNVAQFCVLEMIGNHTHRDVNSQASMVLPSRRLLVGNIHVLFNPSRGDIKLGQVRLFLEKAYKLSQAWGNIPSVLGGDLNSMPQSAMYEFIVSSKLNIQQHERRRISGQICPHNYPDFQSQNKNASRLHLSVSRPFLCRWSIEELRLATGTEGLSHLRHNLKLSSAYCGIPGSSLTRDNSGEPLATSFHSRFMGTVDYIWHTEELVPLKVLETLPVHILKQTGGLPSKRWGSDHLALVCELAFLDDGDET